MTSARTDVDAAVGYYAVALDGILDQAQAIRRPLLLHIAGDDGFVPKETQRKMHEILDPHPQVRLHDYPGEDHGFATEMGKRRSEESAQLADSRTAEFFERNLA
jgi:carboxymethylenebutenolidase